jgi:hypothetical protein
MELLMTVLFLILVRFVSVCHKIYKTWLITLILSCTEQYKWCKCEWQGFPKRYEHSAFIPEHASSEVVVFGGAQIDNNLNDLQVLDAGKIILRYYYHYL